MSAIETDCSYSIQQLHVSGAKTLSQHSASVRHSRSAHTHTGTHTQPALSSVMLNSFARALYTLVKRGGEGEWGECAVWESVCSGREYAMGESARVQCEGSGRALWECTGRERALLLLLLLLREREE